jgi:hypothetical protein
LTMMKVRHLIRNLSMKRLKEITKDLVIYIFNF